MILNSSKTERKINQYRPVLKQHGKTSKVYGVEVYGKEITTFGQPYSHFASTSIHNTCLAVKSFVISKIFGPLITLKLLCAMLGGNGCKGLSNYQYCC